MSDFLAAFSHSLVQRLLAEERMVLRPGTADRVILLLTRYLVAQRQGASLVSTISAGLMSFPDVEELFADDDEIRDLVTDLGRG